MTGKPAEVFNLKDRGTLEAGKKADILIINPETVIDKSTFIEPVQYPEGIEMVMVNGTVVLENGVRAKDITGEVIRIK